MSDYRSQFTCPKCKSHLFGRDTTERDGKVIVLETVRCHGSEEGKQCDWQGTWPELTEQNGPTS